MQKTAVSKSRELHQKLGHPVIDSDGHQNNFDPPVEDYIRAIGGSKFAVRYVPQNLRVLQRTDADRLRTRTTRDVWWVYPTKNTLDRATSALPRLLGERMDDFGLDYCVLFGARNSMQVYRTDNPSIDRRDDKELQLVTLRAINAYKADIYREVADRMTPAFAVPMDTPEGAIAELERVVTQHQAKVISISPVHRPIQAIHEKFPGLRDFNGPFDRHASYFDCFGVDSPYNYDPFWEACLKHKIALMTHITGLGFTGRASVTNYMFNHVGHFADASEAFVKSLFFGGVTRRFPGLRIAVLEAGASSFARVYCDLIARWEKRGRRGLENINPTNLDQQQFADLHARYGGPEVQKHLSKVLTQSVGVQPEDLSSVEIDDFHLAGITSKEQIRDQFVKPFYFGCEADDPMNAVAFNSKVLPLGVKLQAIFASDIGHWDVPDMTEVLEEAYEMVDHGWITTDDFDDFTFNNPMRFFTESNPSFFTGTRVQAAADKFLKAGK